MAKKKAAVEPEATTSSKPTSPSDTADQPSHTEPADQPQATDNKLKRLWRAYLAKKKLTIPLTILLFVGVLLAVPWTRYKAFGLFMTKNFAVTVVDADTNKPVSKATVAAAGKSTTTDGQGKASLTLKPGNAYVTVTKRHYEDAASGITVTLTDGKNNKEIKLKATGRQVPVTVTNKITGKGLKGVHISASDTEAQTDDNGEVSLVLPADKTTEKLTLKLENFNDGGGEIDISEQLTDKNKLTLTPSGKVYFLSKQSGKIDVVKTNLDGTERQLVLVGTGKEDDDTVLLASRDWKYLALKARRDSDFPKLYLIETATDKLTTIDEGKAYFGPVGWHNHDFAYTVERSEEVRLWQPKRSALKSFNADSKSLTTMDETNASGNQYSYAYEQFNVVYIIKDGLVYSKDWSTNGYHDGPLMQDKQSTIIKAKPGTTEKTTLQSFSAPSLSYISASLYAPEEIYFQAFGTDQKTTFYEYEDGKLERKSDANEEDFNKPYPTYLLSPNGNQTFWAEPRDGKNTLFVGNSGGSAGQEIATLSEYNPYGWFGDDYLLTSKKGSELYIMGKAKDATPFKITDYHKPRFNGQGYGYGYGGL